MDEADQQPLGHQRGLPADHGLEQHAIGFGRAPRLGVVARDHMVGEQPQRLAIAAGGEELEGAHADVAGGNAGQHRARQFAVAPDRLAGGDGRQRARRRDAEGRHRLAHDVFAQHGPDRGPAVAVA